MRKLSRYNDTNCWDFDAGELNADETEPLSAQRWIDSYNAVYVCNNRIRPFGGTLAELNASVAEYRSTGYEYWIAKTGDADLYNLYYYEAAEGKFIPSDIGAGQINLKTQLKEYLSSDLSAFTADQLNELFVNARKQLFRATIPDCFDISDAVFHHNFVEFTAGTDQRAKNTYPYNFCTTGSKWRWRLDDADTIFPIDNQGQDRKPYHCEMHDVYSNGQPIWNGETSVFWNMLELAFSAEIAAGMRKMLSAMESLCGQSSGTPYDKVYAFYKKYYLGIKNYFPATLVNADAKRYEIAKIAYNSGSYTNDTDPITQSHGDFCSAETAWVKKRIMYIMSKYSYGLFSNSGTDTIIVRAAGDLIDYEITPAFDMYPAIANGTSIVQGARTKAGEVCRMTIDLGGSADQQNAIQAASWLLSIGDWHRKNVSGTMVVRGRRLTELILGSKTENVIITITGLTLADCGSLQKVLLSNIATLQGTLDLSACQNIREIYADGTGLSQIKVPEGGSLEVIEYPANNKYIGFRNFPPAVHRRIAHRPVCRKHHGLLGGELSFAAAHETAVRRHRGTATARRFPRAETYPRNRFQRGVLHGRRTRHARPPLRRQLLRLVSRRTVRRRPDTGTGRHHYCAFQVLPGHGGCTEECIYEVGTDFGWSCMHQVCRPRS